MDSILFHPLGIRVPCKCVEDHTHSLDVSMAVRNEGYDESSGLFFNLIARISLGREAVGECSFCFNQHNIIEITDYKNHDNRGYFKDKTIFKICMCVLRLIFSNNGCLVKESVTDHHSEHFKCGFVPESDTVEVLKYPESLYITHYLSMHIDDADIDASPWMQRAKEILQQEHQLLSFPSKEYVREHWYWDDSYPVEDIPATFSSVRGKERIAEVAASVFGEVIEQDIFTNEFEMYIPRA
ncbi:MAG: hypothetical protein HY860_06785 [Chlamydiales bacterium]|nr:hypothetical protein [Chlamydiales bacterium]